MRRGLLSGDVEEEITFSPLGDRGSRDEGMEMGSMGSFVNDSGNKKDK